MPKSSNKITQFWQELKRRKVVRRNMVYAASGFVILELVSIIADPLGLPEGTLRFVFFILCIGFVISIILSWYYDFTPDGLEKIKSSNEFEEAPVEKPSQLIAWKIATYISAVIIVGFIIFYLAVRPNRADYLIDLEKSIAVLPFENMSVDEEYSHMGDAITDEIILELQKIKEFDRVLSRSSTMQYKDNRPTIPEMAEKLGVNYIIEGSIQRHKEDVSIRVQVIRAEHEDHVWADEYDGKWEDIFSIQDEMALKVANELKTVLSPEEIEQIDKQPTDNPEAYDLYLKGRYFWN
jgi:TolB-like protein